MSASSPALTLAAPMPSDHASSLGRWNIGVGLVHAVQAVAVLILATAFVLPVTASFI